MAFCAQCGNTVSEDARFCSACGQAIVTPAVQPVTAEPEKTPLQPETTVQQERALAQDTPISEPQQAVQAQQSYYAQPQAPSPQQSYYAQPQAPGPQQSYYAQPQAPSPQQSYYAQPQAPNSQQSYYAQPQASNPQQNYYAHQQNNYGYQNYQKPPYQSGPADVAENKGICVLCYLGILLLIPLLAKPNSAYVKYHSNQGLVLLILNIIIGILAMIPYLGWYLIGPVGYIFTLVCLVIGIVNAVNGQMKPLPLIGGITLMK